MDWEIALYRDEMFQGVEALWRETFPDAPPRNQAAAAIPAKLAVQPDLFLIALEGDGVVGTVMAGYDGHRGWLYSVAVRPSHQRLGVGSALVREAERRLEALGCLKINLQVLPENSAVAAFYEKLGYAIEARISMGKLTEPS
ncbi:MAG TPA: GNAT family acetyltransferase [Caulobacteraceae bacterium]|jgi:ribosomal protein S18 acetylase RimI-like enzyme|nr:GNAT family acetyltransferase [Caulobacteraceae bacterium]